MKAIEIRNATTDNLSDLAGLFNAYRIFYKKESDIEGAKLFLKERIVRNESIIFISFSDDVITGFTQLYPLFSSTRMKKFWLLNDLFVDEKFRGQGISVALIDRAKELCRESDACGFMLETAKTNAIGNQLYQKTGLELDVEHNVYNWEVK
ncbi:MAG TPA: GNAT family N-acetyltransferase [Cyclobacteriaceae bacterium]